MTIVPLRLQDLSKRFGRLAVLRGIDLQTRAGEIVALLGANGCGKTTLLSIAAGLAPASNGTCVWGERTELDTDARRKLAFVAHSTQIYARLTAKENLRLVASLRGDEAGAKTEDGIDRLVARVGLADAADRMAGTFSRGMQQRLAIARALLGAPELLLLDEPFTALDFGGRTLLAKLLLEERERGAAILLTSHDLDAVAEVSDRAVLLEGGRITAEATRDSMESTAAFAERVRRLGTTARPSPSEERSPHA
jgi:heme ABC exporter ATP-binding subunit CcmA